MMEFDTICGTVAIVGRPNVGKSTLMNHLIGQKLSITSRKAQTTRHQVMGIWTEGETQVVFVDTPGIHTGGKRALNRYLNKAASNALQDVDLVVWLLERDKFTDQDAHVEKQVRESGKPVIIALNKFDQVHDKAKLMPVAQKMQMRFPNAEIVPLSALKGFNQDTLMSLITARMPKGPFMFDPDQLTDKSLRFLVAEIVREKLVRQCGDELPYRTTVEIEKFEETPERCFVHACIYVERKSQKPILIGNQGSRLKQIGTEARLDAAELIGLPVHLELWVKVRDRWSDDEAALAQLGYKDP